MNAKVEWAKIVFGKFRQLYSEDHAGQLVGNWSYTIEDEDYEELGLNLSEGQPGLFLLLRKDVLVRKERTPAGQSYGLTSTGESACKHPDTIERILTRPDFQGK